MEAVEATICLPSPRDEPVTRFLAALALLVLGAPASAQTYGLAWWTVDGGGVVGASGGSFTLSGTAGQPDAGLVQAGGTYMLRGGFWGAAVAGGGPQADLSMVMSDSPDPMVGLQLLTYTLAVSNAGPAPATAVTVGDTLPAGVVFASAGGAGWSCGESAGVVGCTRPSLAAGAAASITIVVQAPPFAATLHNSASVSAAEGDPIPGDNTDAESTTVTAAPAADLALDKTAGAAEARWGQPFTYTLAVTNAGPAAVTGASVADTFPPGITGVSWTCTAGAGSSCPSGGSGNINASVSLLAGGQATFTATGTVVAGTVTLVNTASVTPPADVFDPVTANNSDTVAGPAAPIGFYPVAPCRVADTRTATDAPALAANSDRTFDVAGRCSIPADVRAVAVVLTVAGPTDAGNLRLHPAGAAPPLASTINFAAGRARANNAIILLGQGGRIGVRCDMPPGSTGQTHFLFDVTGYFK
jgi:uncharacterized repeat protein (TIGR01451 family)